jgi:uncharacterized protein
MRRLVSLLALVVAIPLAAQNAPAPTPRTVTPAARNLAREVVALLNMEKVVRAGVEAMFDLQVQQQPQMAPFRATMQAWADRHVSGPELLDKIVDIYAEEFSERELRDLVAFYRTPTGRRVAEVSPLLSKRGAEAGAAVAQAHIAELQQMLEARAAELQRGTTPTPPAAPPER